MRFGLGMLASGLILAAVILARVFKTEIAAYHAMEVAMATVR